MIYCNDRRFTHLILVAVIMILQLHLHLLLPLASYAGEESEASIIARHNHKKNGGFVMGHKIDNRRGAAKNTYTKYDLVLSSVPRCDDVPVIFNSCIRSICKHRNPTGITYRNILGFDHDNGECRYVEYYADYGSLSCSIDRMHLDNLDKFLEIDLDDPSQEGSKEVQQFNDIMAQSCHVVPEDDMLHRTIKSEDVGKASHYESTSNVSSPSDKSDKPMKLQAKESLMVQGVAEGEEGKDDEEDDSDYYVDMEGEDGDDYDDNERQVFASFMFLPKELSIINTAAEYVLRGEGEAQAVKKKEPVKKRKHIPNKVFYLNAIMYIDYKTWSIWINGERFTPENWNKNLTVNKVDRKSVTLEWLNHDLDMISPGWRKRLHKHNDHLFVSQRYPIQVKILGDGSASVEFTLRANQSFDLYNFEIVEGDLHSHT